jgi:hypothetical protein
MSDTKKEMRTFESGATRNTDEGKLDYEGFLSPVVLKLYAEYLNKHRKQADGKMRASDNWQSGIPIDVYMKSMLRHVFDVWTIHRDGTVIENDEVVLTQDALCAVLFNAMGYLYEMERPRTVTELTWPNLSGPSESIPSMPGFCCTAPQGHNCVGTGCLDCGHCHHELADKNKDGAS